ncbi:MAG: OmpA family protein [FCB group bacterium]|jgi:outer membrane protein OmpA-like peptidoglycan-associated protein
MKKYFILLIMLIPATVQVFSQYNFAAKKIIYFNDLQNLNLNADDTNYLDALVQYLKANPKFLVNINGYTDNKGTHEENVKRSEEFTKQISLFIESKDITKERIFINPKGESNPLTTSALPEEKAKNNRVEIFVIHTNSDDIEKVKKNFKEE